MEQGLGALFQPPAVWSCPIPWLLSQQPLSRILVWMRNILVHASAVGNLLHCCAVISLLPQGVPQPFPGFRNSGTSLSSSAELSKNILSCWVDLWSYTSDLSAAKTLTELPTALQLLQLLLQRDWGKKTPKPVACGGNSDSEQSRNQELSCTYLDTACRGNSLRKSLSQEGTERTLHHQKDTEEGECQAQAVPAVPSPGTC